ncbi:MAG: TetR/AcrR family transcriptional regulator [Firmicutes bacterium]|jgi:AcrR family transcriptional regulator|nr:TetR/AcrR family transcriptional regulator [Bacillota bacterium]
MTTSSLLNGHASAFTSFRAGRPRNEQSHQAILDACLQLLVEVGYDKMSIERIATLAKVGKATIYRYWTNKAEVVVEAVLHLSDTCHKPDESDFLTGNLRENMIEAVNELCSAIVNTDGAIVSGLVRAMQVDTQLALLVKKNVIEVSMQPITKVIEHGIAKKDISDKIDFQFIYSIILSTIFTRQIITGESLDREFTTYLVDYIVLPLIAYHTDAIKDVTTKK